MSHLSILPTALSDLDRLSSVLKAEGYVIERNGLLPGFAGDSHPFDLKATSPCGHHFAWRRSANSANLELLADVERQGAATTYGSRLQRIVRLYALAKALDAVATTPSLSGVISV
ncbi:MAG: hypothetical protein VKK03_09390 [Synechococcus sp.]|nr:hypothetical protein [Synechococcus sp.]